VILRGSARADSFTVRRGRAPYESLSWAYDPEAGTWRGKPALLGSSRSTADRRTARSATPRLVSTTPDWRLIADTLLHSQGKPKNSLAWQTVGTELSGQQTWTLLRSRD
jgi:hypothetical protein